MSRWPGRLITKTPVTPSGPAPTSTAPGVWTLPEVAYWIKQGLWPSASADPYWSYVSYLLGTTATNVAQNNTFLDSSTNNFTITRYGNPTQGSFTPYGSLWSNYFDGSGDYLSSSGGAATAVGTGDFSVEAFVYWTSYPTQFTTVFSTRSTNNANAAAFTLGVESNGTVYAFSSAYIAQTSSAVFALNTWNHLVLTRSGTSVRIFVNGVLRATGTNSQNFSDQGFAVGANRDGTEQAAGYVSNVRLVKGSIPTDYQTSSTTTGTTIFTPPAVPLTAISGTSLLTCQSNRFRDASSNNFAITKAGDTSVTAFSPFVLAPPGYDTTVNGGSAYFDGNGDGLTAPNNAAFNLGSGDFTLECWVYNTEVGTNCGYAGIWGGGYILYREATTYRFYYGGPSGSPLTPSIAAVANAWTHLAIVRNGTTLSFYVNGVLGGSTSVSTTAISFSGQPFGIGANFETGSVGYPFTGYMANLRLVKGTAVYTAAFTPPTTPPTAVSGTSILCNFTNAGIFDAAMKNDMETVGNAQVSSAQAKFGTTSAYFDGSGDYLSMPSSPSLILGSSNFTAEAWFYAPSTVSSTQQIMGSWDGSSTLSWTVGLGATNKVLFVISTTGAYNPAFDIISTATFSTGTWNHLAFVRNGSAFNLYLNGVSVASLTNSSALYSYPQGTKIGGNTNSQWFNGYLDDVRITNGVARYTANFTPPTAALPVY